MFQSSLALELTCFNFTTPVCNIGTFLAFVQPRNDIRSSFNLSSLFNLPTRINLLTC